MTEKIQKAIDKIDQEAEKMGSATVRLLCSHIIDHCLVNDENADKVLDEGKSLKGCWDHTTSNARKQAAGNCAAVPEDTVYEWAAGADTDVAACRVYFTELQQTAAKVQELIGKINAKDPATGAKLSAAVIQVLQSTARNLEVAQ